MSTSDSTSFSILTDEPTQPSTSNDSDEIDSLPSESSPDSLSDDEEEDAVSDSDAEREWRESLQQLELMLTIVVVPYLGKYFGRKCAYWGWAKFMEWKHPNLEVVGLHSKMFKTAGAVEAAASL